VSSARLLRCLPDFAQASSDNPTALEPIHNQKMANNAYLLSSLRKGPIIVRWIVTHASPEAFDKKSDTERFSFREGVAHLADWEPILHDRMKLIKENPGGVMTVYDEVQRAADMDYANVDPAEAVERWAAAREESIRFLEENTPGLWNSSAIHPERGEVSLYDIANMEVAHDTYHIEHLLQIL